MKMFSFRGPVAAAFLSAVLVACPQPSSPGDALEGQAITLGYDLDLTLQQEFTGSWTVSSLPDWLSAAPTSGTGPLKLVLHAKRSASVLTAAAQAALTGTVRVQWRSDDKQTGEAAFPVQADLYRLQGQVDVSGTALVASDLSAVTPTLRGLSVVPATPSRVIVTYRSAAARTSAMQQEQGVRSAAGQTLTLTTNNVAATLARLRQQPDVQSAVPDAVMSALDMSQSSASVTSTATGTQALAAPLNPTDEYAASQWAYRLLGYPAVWRDMQQTPYTHAVTVAVLDTGVRYDHPDLKGKLYGPGDGALDVLSYTLNAQGTVAYNNGDGDGPDTDPTDPATPGRSDISHGTHVTGIIAANWGSFAPPCATCSGSGVVGASYTAPIKVLPIRVLDAPGGNGSESDIAVAVRYAAGEPDVVVGGKSYTNPHPAQIINLSLGASLTDATQIAVMCDAVAEATRRGALVVAAAGNNGGTRPVYPAACPGAVSVASVSLSDSAVPMHAFYSDQYAQVALSAPGGNPYAMYNGGKFNGQPMPDEILSTGWNYTDNLPSYALEAGTSQAAPQVTTLAALLLSKGVVATPAAALGRMTQTASDLGAAGRDPEFGAGLINPAAALGAAAVGSSVGLSVQDTLGRSYAPALDAVGRFDAYLPDGTFRVVAGQDTNGNGFAGETGEPRSERSVSVGPALTTLNVGTLSLTTTP